MRVTTVPLFRMTTPRSVRGRFIEVVAASPSTGGRAVRTSCHRMRRRDRNGSLVEPGQLVDEGLQPFGDCCRQTVIRRWTVMIIYRWGDVE